MKFFLPGVDDDVTIAQLAHMREKGVRGIYKVTYEHDHSKFELEVGKPRKEFRRQTGPRGGYIKNADYVRLGSDTGAPVTLIIDTGGEIEVFSSPGDGWSYPSLVGVREVYLSPEYFEEFQESGSRET